MSHHGVATMKPGIEIRPLAVAWSGRVLVLQYGVADFQKDLYFVSLASGKQRGIAYVKGYELPSYIDWMIGQVRRTGIDLYDAVAMDAGAEKTRLSYSNYTPTEIRSESGRVFRTAEYRDCVTIPFVNIPEESFHQLLRVRYVRSLHPLWLIPREIAVVPRLNGAGVFYRNTVDGRLIGVQMYYLFALRAKFWRERFDRESEERRVAREAAEAEEQVRLKKEMDAWIDRVLDEDETADPGTMITAGRVQAMDAALDCLKPILQPVKMHSPPSPLWRLWWLCSREFRQAVDALVILYERPLRDVVGMLHPLRQWRSRFASLIEPLL